MMNTTKEQRKEQAVKFMKELSLNDEITSDDIKAIAELKPKAVVFKESGFKDDSAKMNADYTFKRLGIDNVKCI